MPMKKNINLNDSKWLESFGLIAYCIDPINKIPLYLLIRRRESIGYAELLLGHFDIRNLTILQRMMNDMTVYERHCLLTKPWIAQYRKLNPFVSGNRKKHIQTCSQRFHLMKRGIVHPTTGKLVSFKTLADQVTTYKEEIPYEFPKGKKHEGEDSLSCAKRECFEETNLDPSQYIIRNDILPFHETHQGLNLRIYSYTYFVAHVQQFAPPLIRDRFNRHQRREIGDLGWFNFDECIHLFGAEAFSKKNILGQLDSFLRSTFTISTLPSLSTSPSPLPPPLTQLEPNQVRKPLVTVILKSSTSSSSPQDPHSTSKIEKIESESESVGSIESVESKDNTSQNHLFKTILSSSNEKTCTSCISDQKPCTLLQTTIVAAN